MQGIWKECFNYFLGIVKHGVWKENMASFKRKKSGLWFSFMIENKTGIDVLYYKVMKSTIKSGHNF